MDFKAFLQKNETLVWIVTSVLKLVFCRLMVHLALPDASNDKFSKNTCATSDMVLFAMYHVFRLMYTLCSMSMTSQARGIPRVFPMFFVLVCNAISKSTAISMSRVGCYLTTHTKLEYLWFSREFTGEWVCYLVLSFAYYFLLTHLYRQRFDDLHAMYFQDKVSTPLFFTEVVVCIIANTSILMFLPVCEIFRLYSKTDVIERSDWIDGGVVCILALSYLSCFQVPWLWFMILGIIIAVVFKGCSYFFHSYVDN